MRDWLTKDLGWKLFSLFLAVAIWLTVHKIYEEPAVSSEAAAGSMVTYDDLQVSLLSSTLDVRDFRVAPATVAVTVSGPSEVMAVLQANKIHAVVDLTGIESAKDLRRNVDILLPPGVALVSVRPTRVGVIIPPPTDKK